MKARILVLRSLTDRRRHRQSWGPDRADPPAGRAARPGDPGASGRLGLIPRAPGAVAQALLGIPVAHHTIRGLLCRACYFAPRGLRLLGVDPPPAGLEASHLNCFPRPNADLGTRSWLGEYFGPRSGRSRTSLRSHSTGRRLTW